MANTLKRGLELKALGKYNRADPDSNAREYYLIIFITYLKRILKILQKRGDLIKLKEINKTMSELIPIEGVLVRASERLSKTMLWNDRQPFNAWVIP